MAKTPKSEKLGVLQAAIDEKQLDQGNMYTTIMLNPQIFNAFTLCKWYHMTEDSTTILGNQFLFKGKPMKNGSS
jgi:hypothetical protein